jgi:hypothetical protein
LRRWRQGCDLADVGDNSGKHFSTTVMAGLVPAIHVFLFIRRQDVDARVI